MPAFNYIGRDANGSQVKGAIEAVNSAMVAEQLSRKRIIPISIESAKQADSDISSKNIDISDLLGFNQVTLDDLIVFCRQMYALVKSGVPILRAINGMAESSTSVKLKSALTDISAQLEGGFPLSNALHQHPKIFTPLFVCLLYTSPSPRD